MATQHMLDVHIAALTNELIATCAGSMPEICFDALVKALVTGIESYVRMHLPNDTLTEDERVACILLFEKVMAAGRDRWGRAPEKTTDGRPMGEVPEEWKREGKP